MSSKVTGLSRTLRKTRGFRAPSEKRGYFAHPPKNVGISRTLRKTRVFRAPTARRGYFAMVRINGGFSLNRFR